MIAFVDRSDIPWPSPFEDTGDPDHPHPSCVRLVDLLTGERRGLPSIWPGPSRLAFSHDGQLLAAVYGATRLIVTDLAGDNIVLDHEEGVRMFGVDFAPHDLGLAVSGPDGLRVWERQGRAGPWQLVHRDHSPILALAWSPTGDHLALGNFGELGLFDLGTRQRLSPPSPDFPTNHEVVDLVFIDSGKGLLTLAILHAEKSGELRYYDLSASPARLVHSQALPWFVFGCFSIDGTRLAWLAGSDSAIRIQQTPLGTSEGQVGWDLDSRLRALRFSPDGHTLASFADDGTIKLIPWRLLLRR
jgi:WD40 repeat protein